MSTSDGHRCPHNQTLTEVTPRTYIASIPSVAALRVSSFIWNSRPVCGRTGVQFALEWLSSFSGIGRPARRAVTRHVRPVARRVSAPVRRINQAPIKPQAIRTPPRCPPCAPCTPCLSPKLSQPQLGPLTKKPTLSPYQPTLKSEVVRNQSTSNTTPHLRSNYSTAQ